MKSHLFHLNGREGQFVGRDDQGAGSDRGALKFSIPVESAGIGPYAAELPNTTQRIGTNYYILQFNNDNPNDPYIKVFPTLDETDPGYDQALQELQRIEEFTYEMHYVIEETVTGNLSFSARPNLLYREGTNFVRYEIPIPAGRARENKYKLKKGKVNINGRSFKGNIVYNPDLSRVYIDVKVKNIELPIIHGKKFSDVRMKYTFEKGSQTTGTGNDGSSSHIVEMEDPPVYGNLDFSDRPDTFQKAGKEFIRYTIPFEETKVREFEYNVPEGVNINGEYFNASVSYNEDFSRAYLDVEVDPQTQKILIEQDSNRVSMQYTTQKRVQDFSQASPITVKGPDSPSTTVDLGSAVEDAYGLDSRSFGIWMVNQLFAHKLFRNTIVRLVDKWASQYLTGGKAQNFLSNHSGVIDIYQLVVQIPHSNNHTSGKLGIQVALVQGNPFDPQSRNQYSLQIWLHNEIGWNTGINTPQTQINRIAGVHGVGLGGQFLTNQGIEIPLEINQSTRVASIDWDNWSAVHEYVLRPAEFVPYAIDINSNPPVSSTAISQSATTTPSTSFAMIDDGDVEQLTQKAVEWSAKFNTQGTLGLEFGVQVKLGKGFTPKEKMAFHGLGFLTQGLGAGGGMSVARYALPQSTANTMLLGGQIGAFLGSILYDVGAATLGNRILGLHDAVVATLGNQISGTQENTRRVELNYWGGLTFGTVDFNGPYVNHSMTSGPAENIKGNIDFGFAMYRRSWLNLFNNNTNTTKSIKKFFNNMLRINRELSQPAGALEEVVVESPGTAASGEENFSFESFLDSSDKEITAAESRESQDQPQLRKSVISRVVEADVQAPDYPDQQSGTVRINFPEDLSDDEISVPIDGQETTRLQLKRLADLADVYPAIADFLVKAAEYQDVYLDAQTGSVTPLDFLARKERIEKEFGYTLDSLSKTDSGDSLRRTGFQVMNDKISTIMSHHTSDTPYLDAYYGALLLKLIRESGYSGNHYFPVTRDLVMAIDHIGDYNRVASSIVHNIKGLLQSGDVEDYLEAAKNWSLLDTREKSAVAKSVFDRILPAFQLENPPEIQFDSAFDLAHRFNVSVEDAPLAVSFFDDNQIVLDLDRFTSASELVGAIGHELFHHYQKVQTERLLLGELSEGNADYNFASIAFAEFETNTSTSFKMGIPYDHQPTELQAHAFGDRMQKLAEDLTVNFAMSAAAKKIQAGDEQGAQFILDDVHTELSSGNYHVLDAIEEISDLSFQHNRETTEELRDLVREKVPSDQRQNFDDLFDMVSDESSISGSEHIDSMRILPERRISEFLQSIAPPAAGRVITNIELDIENGEYTVDDLIDAVREKAPHLNQKQKGRIFSTFNQIDGIENTSTVHSLERLRSALYSENQGFGEFPRTSVDSYEHVPLYQSDSGNGMTRYYDQLHNPMSEEEVSSFFNRLWNSVSQARNKINETDRSFERLEAADLKQTLLTDLKSIAAKLNSEIYKNEGLSWENLRSVDFNKYTNEITLLFKNENNPYSYSNTLKFNLEETISGMKSGEFIERLHHSFQENSRFGQSVQHLGRGLGTWVTLKSFKDMVTALEHGDVKDAILPGLFTSIGVAQVTGLDRAVLNALGRGIGRVVLKDADIAFKTAGKANIGELDTVISRGVGSLFERIGVSAGTASKAGELFARVPFAAAVFGGLAIKGDVDTLRYDEEHHAPKWKQNLDIADIVIDSVDTALFATAPFTGPAAPFVEAAAVAVMAVRVFVDDIVTSIEAEEAKAHNNFERLTYGVEGFFKGIGKGFEDIVKESFTLDKLYADLLGKVVGYFYYDKMSEFTSNNYLQKQGAESAGEIFDYSLVSRDQNGVSNYEINLLPKYTKIYKGESEEFKNKYDIDKAHSFLESFSRGIKTSAFTAGNVVVDISQPGRVNVQWEKGSLIPKEWENIKPQSWTADTSNPRHPVAYGSEEVTRYRTPGNKVEVNHYDSYGYAVDFSVRRENEFYPVHTLELPESTAKVSNVYLGMGAAYTPKMDIKYQIIPYSNFGASPSVQYSPPDKPTISLERQDDTTGKETIYGGDNNNRFFAPQTTSLYPDYHYYLFGGRGDDVLHLGSFGQYNFYGGADQDLVSFSYAGIMKSVPEGQDPHDRSAIWYVDMQSSDFVKRLDSSAVNWEGASFDGSRAQDHSDYMQVHLIDVEGIITSNENAGVYRGDAGRNVFIGGSKAQFFIRSAGDDSYFLHEKTNVVFIKENGPGVLAKNVGTDYVSIPYLYDNLSCGLDTSVARIIAQEYDQKVSSVMLPTDQIDQSINFISKDGVLFNLEIVGSRLIKKPKLIFADKWLSSRNLDPIGIGINYDLEIDFNKHSENLGHTFAIAPSSHRRIIRLSSITFDEVNNHYYQDASDVGILLKYKNNHSIRLAPGKEKTTSFVTKDGVCFSVDSRPASDGFRNREVYFKDMTVRSAESRGYYTGESIALSDTVRSLLTQGKGALSQFALQDDSFKTDRSVLTRNTNWRYLGSDASELVQGDGGDNTLIASKGTDLLDGGNGYDQYLIRKGSGVNVLHDSGSDHAGSKVIFSGILYREITFKVEKEGLLIGVKGDENSAAWIKIGEDEIGQYTLFTQDGASFTFTKDEENNYYRKTLLSIDYKSWYLANHNDSSYLSYVSPTSRYSLYGSDKDEYLYAGSHTLLIIPGKGNDVIYLPVAVESLGDTNSNTFHQINVGNGDGRNTININHDGQNTLVTVLFQGLEFSQISQMIDSTSRITVGRRPTPNSAETSVVIAQSDIGNFIFKDKNGLQWTASANGFQLLGVDLSDEGITTRRIDLNHISPTRLAFADTVSSRGSKEADEISGVLGTKNEIVSGAGNDRITGGDKNDFLLGGKGEDSIYGGKGDDLLTGGAGIDNLYGGEGVDTAAYIGDAIYEQGVEINLATGRGNRADADGDSLQNIENVRGSIFNDILTGNVSDNFLYGNAGNDLLQGGGGFDILSGGKGRDTYKIMEGENVFIVEEASTQADSSILDMSIFARNKLSTRLEDDTLLIFGKNVKVRIKNWSSVSQQFEMYFKDEILLPYQVDMFLSRGNTADFHSTAQPVVADANISNTPKVDNENILLGTDGEDIFTLNGDQDSIDGRGGFDTLRLAGSTQSGALVSLAGGYVVVDGERKTIRNIERVEGTFADDRFIGDANGNVFSGSGGDDIFFASGGSDHYDGDSGNDRIVYHDALEGITVNLEETDNRGYVTLTMTDRKTDYLRSIESLALTNFNDQVTGNSEDNVFIGGLGDDTVDGRRGYDTLSFDVDSVRHVSVDLSSKDALGWSEITLSGAGRTRIKNIEKFVLSSGNDVFKGDNAPQRIYARLGDDFFYASLGNDHMDGGLGRDGITFHGVFDRGGIVVQIGFKDAQGWTPVYNGNIPVAAIRGIECIEGTDGIDTIIGDHHDNEIEGRGGNDYLDGGGGINTLSFRHSTKYWDANRHAYVGVMVDLGRNTAAQRGTGVPNNKNTIRNFSNVIGSAWADEIKGDDSDNIITGGAGDDLYTASAGRDTYRFASGDGHDRYRIGTRLPVAENNLYHYSINPDIPVAEKDVIDLEDNIQKEALRFERIDNDLRMSIQNSQDSITFEGWYDSSGTRQSVDGFQLGQYFLASNDVERLVTAMASFSAASSTLTYGYHDMYNQGNQSYQNQNIQSVINDVWKLK